MGEGLKPYFHEVSSSSVRRDEDEDEDELGESSSLSNDSHHDDDDDDESNSNEGELSTVVSQLPIKKGLSSFYQGKSQSFSSFAEVRSVLDLAKREEPTAMKSKMMKPSRSYAWGLDEASNQNANIRLISGAHCKNGSIGYCASSIARTSNFAGTKPPTVSSQQNS